MGRLRDIHRALVEIGLPELSSRQGGVQAGGFNGKGCRRKEKNACPQQENCQKLTVIHLVMLPMVCKISSSRGQVAASTRQRPASPTHQPSESAPASSQRVRV